MILNYGISLIYQDMEGIQDSLAEEKIKTRKAQESQLSMLTNLRDQKIESRDWSELDESAVLAEVTRLTDEVDMNKITDKLGDGMSRIPTETVDDPTAISDEANQKSEEVTVEDLQMIEQHFMQIRISRGQAAAETYIREQQMKGNLPQDKEE